MSQNVPQNVAVGKTTSIQKASSAAASANFRKFGDKNNLVDGSISATVNNAITDCSGCFASFAIEGYWQVNLGDKYFVPYIKIVGVTGERIILLCTELPWLLKNGINLKHY